MPVKVGKGRSEVTISGALGDDLEAEIRAILGPVADAMQAEADAILKEEVGEKWPVKSGKSRGAWVTTLRVQPDSMLVEIVLSNPFAYTRYIRSTRVGRNNDATRRRKPLQVHVRKPSRAAVKSLKKSLPGIIAQALEDGVLT